MPRISEEDKARKKEIVWSIVQRHNGISETEISAEINVQQRTVNNYLRELDDEAKIYKEGILWFASDFQVTRLQRFDLSAEEAFVLYLAARAFVKQTDKRNEPAEQALNRLAQRLTGSYGVGDEIYQASRELAQRPTKPGYQPIFQTVTRAYLFRRQLKLVYKPYKGEAFKTIFEPYLIEPSAIGYTIYAIGTSSAANGQLRSYKMDRIISAEMLREEYIVPATFPGLDILRNAWSIMIGEKTERVTLRFSKNVRERVLETNWHPSQGHLKEENGSLSWWVHVANTTDILPWIRSWGGDVEIISPDSLREQMKAHVVRLTNTYKVGAKTDTSQRRLILPWGKTTRDPFVYHPALYHMIDVANIAFWLLSSHASPRWRNVLAHTLNTAPEQLQEWVPFLIALHDVGKLSVSHQLKNTDQADRLRQAGFAFGSYNKAQHNSLHHTIMGYLHLVDSELGQQLPRQLKYALLTMIAGHHGYYQNPQEYAGKLESLHEPAEWGTLRDEAIEVLRQLFLQRSIKDWPESTNVSAAIATLNGFTILCDWLGSDQTFFTAQPHMPLTEYMAHSRQQAFDRLNSADFFHAVRSLAPRNFASLFPFAPRPLQTAIDHIPTQLLAQPTLTIIEAPTGEGKTEAALALAHRIGHQRGTDELYIALPTTATSNAMYQRVQHYLVDTLRLPKLVKLVHGQDYLQKELRLDFENLHDDAYPDSPPALAWFAPKKQALLAPFGVGTVDQAELSALNVRHNALRLIGLAGKTVILDEVHAYDTYMLAIIGRMLTWLAQIGTSVILLSATLPTSKRQELAQAFAGNRDLPDFRDSYPALVTIGTQQHYIDFPPAIQSDRQIGLRVLHFEDDSVRKAQWLLAQVERGGCACWITNTVAQAQSMFEAVQQLAPDDTECTLLHARFPLQDRQDREQMILRSYGKQSAESSRPKKGIVIGTQVLEQSLDLDFDLMVSDLAPIDLILQRAGRLHRHINRSNRSPNHPEPILYVHARLDQTGNLAMGPDRFYGEYTLRLSWEQITARISAEKPLSLPTDYRPLVEAVYTATPPDAGTDLYNAWVELESAQRKLEGEANSRLTPEPHPRRPFTRTPRITFREDEESNAWIVAQTRYSERPSLTVIPLERIDSDTCQLPDGTQIALNHMADRKTQLCLLKRQLRVSSRKLVPQLLAAIDERPMLFTKSTLLKHCQPIWLENGVGITLPVILDGDLGLVESTHTKDGGA